MDSTSLTLLQRVQSQADSAAWQSLFGIYQPLISRWLRLRNTAPQDADDLTQEVLVVVLRELPTFCHNGQTGAFRAWLRAITANRLRTFWRKCQGKPMAIDMQEMADQLEDSSSEISQQFDRQHDQYVLDQLLELMAQEFEPKTLSAFRLVGLEGKKAEEAAGELDMSVVAVYIAKSRVLRRLREVAHGILD